MSDLYNEMERRYRENDLPWGVELPPPEVLEIAEQLPPSRMLDLGCGLGRASIYLARRGWICDGVDFIAEAVDRAKSLAEAAGVGERTRFFRASVAELDFLEPFYDFALDVGCFHGQPAAVKQAYLYHLTRLLRPGGLYLLFARLQDEPAQPDQNWLTERSLKDFFAADFQIERYEPGTSNFGPTVVAPSAWVWLRRKA